MNKERLQKLAGILKEDSGDYSRLKERLSNVVDARRAAESLLDLLNRAMTLIEESEREEWGKKQLLEEGEHVLDEIEDEFRALSSNLESGDIYTPDW